jgi:hypothetical protein
MHCLLPYRRKSAHGLAGLLLAATVASSGPGWSQETAPGSESLAAWDEIAQVLRHPRCLNCHQLNRPLQGDARRVHVPAVVRGVDNLGAGTMRCRNCHNWTGNNEMAGVPGALHWQLAPASMRWEGLSTGDLCRMLKNPELNGRKTPQDIVKHIETDELVRWGWQPGAGRGTSADYAPGLKMLKIWVAGSTACPQ